MLYMYSKFLHYSKNTLEFISNNICTFYILCLYYYFFLFAFQMNLDITDISTHTRYQEVTGRLMVPSRRFPSTSMKTLHPPQRLYMPPAPTVAITRLARNPTVAFVTISRPHQIPTCPQRTRQNRLRTIKHRH